MNIWVDADACPVAIREILFRVADRTGLKLVLVANHRIPIPKSGNISFKQVGSGFDKADHYIEDQIVEGDLLVTNDIPLAADCIEKSAIIINTKGEKLTQDNIRERLNIRDFMDTMRASGINTGGPPPLSKSDIKAFADALDRIITNYTNSKN